MRPWSSSRLSQDGTVNDAIRVLETSTVKIVLVIDGENRLKGTVTDGDIRRGLLRGISLAGPVSQVMRTAFTAGRPEDGPERLRELMAHNDLRQIPILDPEGRVVGLVTSKDLAGSGRVRDNWVVLMAGGLGQRLRPLTEDVPKPLLTVGRKPLLETILETFLAHDFRRFYISVNYKAEMIKAHFGDGANWSCDIRYIEENERLGTAGALALLPEAPVKPLVVMNGDVLTTVNFTSLLDFHAEHKSAATMCVREYDFQVPYGVVLIEDHRITGIAEKPVHTFFVNAGIYALDPETVARVPRNQPCDMPDLFARVIADGKTTAAFPIREYWMDIGRLDDFQRANGDYTKIFE